MFPGLVIFLHTVFHSVLILESGSAAQDISKLGICHPGGRRAAEAPGKKKFSRRQRKQWLEKCLFTASAPHSHLHKSPSSCWDRLSRSDAASRVYACWDDDRNNVGTAGLRACDAVQEGKPSGMWRLVCSQCWDGFLGPLAVAQSAGGEGPCQSKIWPKNGSSFSQVEDKTMHRTACKLKGRVKSSGVFWPFRSFGLSESSLNKHYIQIWKHLRSLDNIVYILFNCLLQKVLYVYIYICLCVCVCDIYIYKSLPDKINMKNYLCQEKKYAKASDRFCWRIQRTNCPPPQWYWKQMWQLSCRPVIKPEKQSWGSLNYSQ